MSKETTWLEESLKDKQIREAFAREWLVESFLTAIEEEMTKQGVNRKQLAERMGCALPNISRAMRGVTNLTTQTMANMALALNHLVAPKLEQAPGIQLYSGPMIEFTTNENALPLLQMATSGLPGVPSEYEPETGFEYVADQLAA